MASRSEAHGEQGDPTAGLLDEHPDAVEAALVALAVVQLLPLEHVGADRAGQHPQAEGARPDEQVEQREQEAEVARDQDRIPQTARRATRKAKM